MKGWWERSMGERGTPLCGVRRRKTKSSTESRLRRERGILKSDILFCLSAELQRETLLLLLYFLLLWLLLLLLHYITFGRRLKRLTNSCLCLVRDSNRWHFTTRPPARQFPFLMHKEINNSPYALIKKINSMNAPCDVDANSFSMSLIRLCWIHSDMWCLWSSSASALTLIY